MENLKEQLDLHKKWLLDTTKGKRLDLSNADLRYADLRYADLRYANLIYADLSNADLSNADLSNADLSNADLIYANLSNADLINANLINANLRYADLRCCIGNNKEIKSLQIGTYLISYTKDILNIGCKSYTLKEWKKFNDNEISHMDSKALDWWKLNKDIIISIVEREL